MHLPDAIGPDGLTMAKIRKIFRLFIEWRLYVYPNEKALETIELFLADYIPACKKTAEATADYYERNKRDPMAIIGNTKSARSERRSIRERNKELLQEVKQTEKMYQRAQKIKDIWDELKAQYVM